MTMLPSFYVIALGSNLGDRLAILSEALHRLALHAGTVVETSPMFETEPIGAADQAFLNAAVLLKTTLKPDQLLAILLKTETEMGRERAIHWGNRTLDLDILLGLDADGTPIVLDNASLSIPHPRMLERDFALVPAAAVAGHWVHPLSGLTLDDECTQRGFRLEAMPPAELMSRATERNAPASL